MKHENKIVDSSIVPSRPVPPRIWSGGEAGVINAERPAVAKQKNKLFSSKHHFSTPTRNIPLKQFNETIVM